MTPDTARDTVRLGDHAMTVADYTAAEAARQNAVRLHPETHAERAARLAVHNPVHTHRGAKR